MEFDQAHDPIGMSEAEMFEYLKEVLREEAAEAAAESGKSVDEELESREFNAVAAAATYAIKLLDANNMYITRQLLDRGILKPPTE